MITNKKKFFIEILKGVLKLIIAGIFIGYLKEYDFWIAVILGAKLLHNIYKDIVKPTHKNWILLIGMLLTCFGGIVGETWGVSNGYWEYHAVERELPLWLPFAWMYLLLFI